MKRFLFLVVLLASCAIDTVEPDYGEAVVDTPIETPADLPTEPEAPVVPEVPAIPETPELEPPEVEEIPVEIPQEEEVKTLAPIDESAVYIWDGQNIYNAADLPKKPGAIAPINFLYSDGTKANVIAFEFYQPGKAFYIKCKELVEKKEDGITTGWEEVETTYRQKGGKVTKSTDVFPVYEPVPVKEFTFKNLYIGPAGEFWTFFPSDEYGVRMGFCSCPFKYISHVQQSGETLWFIGERADVDHPQLFTIEQVTCEAKRWMDYAKVIKA